MIRVVMIAVRPTESLSVCSIKMADFGSNPGLGSLAPTLRRKMGTIIIIIIALFLAISKHVNYYLYYTII